MGSGVALFDYDNDGRLDIFLTNGAPLSDPTARGDDSAQDAGRSTGTGCTTRNPTAPLKT